MADVVRDAIVRFRIEMDKQGLGSVDTSGLTKAFEAEARAAKEAAKAKQESAAASQQYAKSTRTAASADDAYYARLKANIKDVEAMQKHEREARRVATHDGNVFNAISEGAANEVNQKAIVVQDANERMAQSAERFGTRSSYAYTRGVGGITEFARGLAMLSANGSQDNQKLLQSIVAVQGAVDVVRGISLMTRLGPELGAGAALVTAGTAAWMLYSNEVGRAKAEIDKLTASHHDAIKAEQELAAEHESIRAKGQAAQTDANLSPTEKRAAQDKELLGIHQRRKDTAKEVADSERQRKYSLAQAQGWRSEASTLPDSYVRAVLMYGSSREAGAAVERRRALLEGADSTEKGQELRRSEEIGKLNNSLTDANREQEIYKDQHSQRVAQIRQREQEQMAGLRTAEQAMTPQQKAIRDRDDQRTRREIQRETRTIGDFAPAFGAMGGGLGGFFGGVGMMDASGSRTPENIREQPFHEQAKRDLTQADESFTRLAKMIAQKITALEDELKTISAANPR